MKTSPEIRTGGRNGADKVSARAAGRRHPRADTGTGAAAPSLPPAAIFEVLPIALVVIDLDTPSHPIIYCNRAFEKLSGSRRESILGLPCEKNAPANGDHPSRLDQILRALARMRSSAKLRLPGRNGLEIPCRLITERIKASEATGGRNLLLGKIRDGSCCAESEAKLQQAMMLLGQMRSVAGIGEWTLRHENGRIEWSHEVYKMHGMNPEEFKGTLDGVMAMYHPEDRERVISRFTQHLADGEPYLIAMRIVLPSGEIKHVQAYCESIFSASGTPLVSTGLSIDVSNVKEAQEALRDSNERFRLAQEASGGAIADWTLGNPDFTWYLPLGEGSETRAWPVASSGPQSFEDYKRSLHPEDRDRVLGNFDAVVADPSIRRWEVEYRMLDTRGGYRHVLESLVIERDAEGRARRVVAALRDITPLKKINTELSEAKTELEHRARLQALLMEASTLFIGLPQEEVGRTILNILGQIGGYLDATQVAVCCLLHDPVDPEILLSWTAPQAGRDFVPLDTNAIHELGRLLPPCFSLRLTVAEPANMTKSAGLRAMLESRGISRMISVPITDGGRLLGLITVLHAQQAPPCGPSQDERNFLQFLARILASTRKRLENLAALDENRRFLEDLVENSGSPIYSKNLEGVFTMVNKAWERTTGVSRADVIGTKATSILDRQAVHEIREHDQQVLDSGAALEFEESIPDRANPGERRHFITTRFPNRNARGEITGITGICTEVTSRVRAEAERRARETAESAARARLDFLARLSHEIRTPIHAILGFGGLLKRDADPGSNRHRHATLITQSGRQLLQLIDDLLQFNRMESGRVDVRPNAFDLDAFLADLLDLTRQRAAEKGLSLALRRGRALPPVIVSDSTKIRQVLLNLIGNAVKFTRRGRVTLDVRVEAAADARTCNWLVFNVADSGPGIPDAEIALVFDDFYQGSAGLAAASGSGLGLAICRQIAAALDGRLRIAKSTPKGSVFSFSVPLVENGAISSPEDYQRVPSEELRDFVSHASGGNLLAKDRGKLPPTICGRLAPPLHIGDMAAVRRILQALLRKFPKPAREMMRLADAYDYVGLKAVLDRTAAVESGGGRATPSQARSRAKADILVVDDSATNLRLLEDILNGGGYRARCAPDARAAIDMASLAPPDLVLVDVLMPDVDGFALRAAMLRRQNLRDIPFLFNSATKSEDLLTRVFRLKGCGFIAKPFHPGEILATVADRLRLAALDCAPSAASLARRSHGSAPPRAPGGCR